MTASDRWHTLRLEALEAIPLHEGLGWKPLRRALGVEAFGVNVWVGAQAGDRVLESHTEAKLRHEEVYVVLAGRATFDLDGEALDAPAGTVVAVHDPDVRRGAVAAEGGTAVLVVGGRRGEAYTPSAWESFYLAERHRATADFAAMAADLEAALEEFPEHPGVLYNLACAEALAGRHEEAAAHLRRSIALDPAQAEWARTDTDLDPIRHLPGVPG